MEFIKNFKIIRKLGSGGQGDVYLAEHEKKEFKFTRLVSIKVLAKNEYTIENFSQEVQVLSSLHHPKICHIYDVGETHEHYFIVMEFVDGYSLSEFLQETYKKNLEIETGEIVEILISIITAIKYAHELVASPILHRDLCPHNIMISKSAEVVLIDFGISNLLASKDESRIIKGKPSYLPTKILTGEEPYSTKTELYSIGVVAYECITGKKVYSEDDIDLDNIEDEDLSEIIKLMLEFDGNYENILKALKDKQLDEKSNLNNKVQQIFDDKFISEKTAVLQKIKQKTFYPRTRTKKYFISILLLIIPLSLFFLTKTSIWDNYQSQKNPLSEYKGKYLMVRPNAHEQGISFNEDSMTTITINSKGIKRKETSPQGCKRIVKLNANHRDEAMVLIESAELTMNEKYDENQKKCINYIENILMPSKLIQRFEFRKDANYLYIRSMEHKNGVRALEEKFQKMK
jgi:serine/threonine protein kinase